MNSQDKTIKAAQAILHVIQEHDLTKVESLSALNSVFAVIIVDAIDNGDIDESTAKRLLSIATLNVHQYILSRGGKREKSNIKTDTPD